MKCVLVIERRHCDLFRSLEREGIKLVYTVEQLRGIQPQIVLVEKDLVETEEHYKIFDMLNHIRYDGAKELFKVIHL
jgi:hypothetical protein